MAVLLNASGEDLQVTTNLIDYNLPYTQMAWFYINSQPDAALSFFGITDGNDTGSLSNYDYVALISSTNFYIDVGVAGSNNIQPSFASGFGVWVHVAVVRESATALTVYENGAFVATNSTNITGRAAVGKNIVGALNAAFPYELDGNIDQLYQYSAALTNTEILNQMYRSTPQRTANLVRYMPSPSDAQRSKDYSGNGYNWTENGSVSFVQGYSGLVHNPLVYPKQSLAAPVYNASPLMLLAC